MTGTGGGGAVVPLPDKAIDEGLPAALWAIDREADFAPAEVGVNVTVKTAADGPAAIVAVVEETENCAASVPVTVMPVTDSVSVPVLEIDKESGLLWPICTSPKGRGDGEMDMTGAMDPAASPEAPLRFPVLSTAAILK